MLLILSVIVMCSYLYPVCLVSPVLKNTHFKEHLLVFASKYRNLHYVQCLNIAPMEKAWFMTLTKKELWPQWNIPSWFIAPVVKAWIYEILFYQVVIVMVKDKNRCTIKGTTSIKIFFMHYRNYITWTRVKLPVFFEEFNMVYIFWILFTFNYHCQLVNGQL